MLKEWGIGIQNGAKCGVLILILMEHAQRAQLEQVDTESMAES